MQQTINSFLSRYINYAYPPYMWRAAYLEEIDQEAVSRLRNRRRFPTDLIDTMTLNSSNACVAMQLPEVSILNKLSALSIYKKAASTTYFNKASIATFRDLGDRTGACLIESGLNMTEVLSLLCIAIKNLYKTKSQCDVKSYWMNLDQYISWQSLTNPLRRFPANKRKEIYRNFGRLLCSYTSNIQPSKEIPHISIF